jgi:chorismate synthase
MPLFFSGGVQADSHASAAAADRNYDGEETSFVAQGRHDPCPVPRAVPIVEAMTAIVLADFYLLWRATRPGKP